jgi:hypothetical protein
LQALREGGWRLMVSAAGVLRTEGFAYALDNGAWSSFQAKESFDFPRFERALKLLGADSDFVVVPDIVAGGKDSLKLTQEWLPRVLAAAPRAAIAVQDGMIPFDIGRLVSRRVGVFVGGSTDWKLETMGVWARLARARIGHSVTLGASTRLGEFGCARNRV